MPFQASTLPRMASVPTHLLPSFATVVTMPFRYVMTPPTAKPFPFGAHLPTEIVKSQSPSTVTESGGAKADLPALIRSTCFDSVSQANRPAPTYVPSLFNIYRPLSVMTRSTLVSWNPVTCPMSSQQVALRPLSSMMASGQYGTLFKTGMSQRRGYQVDRLSRNLLARMEERANRNPSNAAAQTAFYTALLAANLPALVVERYQSGRFATNQATDEAYNKAVGLLSPGPHPGSVTRDGAQADASGLNPSQLQAVAQAVAARHQGANLSVTTGQPGSSDPNRPVHVLVDETFGSTVFRWVKFVAWFVLVTYLSMVVITMMVEGLSTFRRPGGGKVDSEVKAENQKTRFADVHGADEAKDELQELVDFLRNPEKFSALGGKLPKGVLLVGPPGTGKTLLARAVAGEAGVPFFYMSGSEFDEVYVGVGAKRVRDLFTAAKARSPSIVFIDELDAVGGRRNARDATYVKQTLNQLLTELDGFEQNSGVVIIGATNFPKSLDPALIRPGRFDRHVQVDLPDVRGRLAILKHHAKKIKLGKEVDFEALARSTPGLSGAELENIVNQAAVHASRVKSTSVNVKDFEWAKDKVIMGAEKRTMIVSPREKEMTAYHEAGHALVNLLSESNSHKLYKVTILARGQTLGHTGYLPEMDKHSYTASNYKGIIDTALGGKLAEEMVYGPDNVTSGVSADLQHATSVAFHMVASYGMSHELGHVDYGSRYENLSSETRARIEAEVQRVIHESYERCRKLLAEHRKELDLLAKGLVEYETLDRAEVEKIIRGEKLDRASLPPNAPLIVQIPEKPPVPGLPRPHDGPGHTGSPPPPPPPSP